MHTLALAVLLTVGPENPLAPRELPPGTVTLPYAFPGVGRYRIWVQVKVKGRILTGVFDAQVGS